MDNTVLDIKSSADIARDFNNVASRLKGIITFAQECHGQGLDWQGFLTSIQPDIQFMIGVLESIDYSDDLKTSAHCFAIQAAEACMEDAVVDITDETWAYGDVQKVKSITNRAQAMISDIQKTDPLWSGVTRGTSLIFDTSPPVVYTRFDPRGLMTLASHSVIAISDDATKMVDTITMNVHPDNHLIQNKKLWLSALLHENFHGLEYMRNCSGYGPSAARDRTLFHQESVIYDRVRLLSHDLYEAMPKERLARDVQEKFVGRVNAAISEKRPLDRPMFRR